MNDEIAKILEKAEKNPNFKTKLKSDPIAVLEEENEKSNPLLTDPWIYRIIVMSLGTAIILCIIFAFIIANYSSNDTPQILIAIGSAAVGALAGLLAPSPKQKE